MANIYDASTMLNAIYATASNAYQTTVPLTTADNIVDVGEAVLTAPADITNEFYAAIVNLVGMQLFTTVDFTNPLSGYKKGRMPYGMTIEDIYVAMARGQEYVSGTRTGDSVPDQYEVNKAVVDAAFYSAQLERQYGKTLHTEDIRRAFQSENPVATLTSMVIQSMRTGEEYDDYRMTVALMARQLEEAETATDWNGHISLVSDYNTMAGTSLTSANCLNDQDFLTYMAEMFQTWSDRLKYVRSDLNIAGVDNTLPKNRQNIWLLGDINAKIRTKLLAWAYNADQLTLGNVTDIDAWYSISQDATPTSSPDDIIVKADNGLTGSKPCVGVMFDPMMLKIYNKVNITENARNARGHYTNIWHTVGDIYACSPFNNFVAFYLD